MIWLVGCNGMLGREIALSLRQKGYEFYSSDIDVDITSMDVIEEYVRNKHIDTIINCVAYTQVDKAETEHDKAFEINCTAVENLVSVANTIRAVLIHFSTDYVFSGSGHTPVPESVKPDPRSYYGKTKYEGERIVLEKAEKFYIFRLSWLYGSHGKNFVHTMLNLFENNDTVNVVDDQFGSPTYAGDVADFVCGIIISDPGKYGLYHFSGEGETTWYDFALAIYKIGREIGLVGNDVAINAVPSTFFTYPAPRPAYSYMDKTKFYENFDYDIMNWRDTLRRYLQERLSTSSTAPE